MSAIAAAVKHMLAAGMPHDAIVQAVADMEAAMTAPRDPVAERKRERDRVRMAQKRSDSRATSRESSDKGDTPPPPSFPPEPPQTPTPTRESISSREERAREEAGFERFWSAYPRKVGKADARKAFAKAWRKLPPFDEDLILSGGLERAKAAWTDAQFIPHAATWLNGERWTDEPTVIPLKRPHERPDTDAKQTAREANYARAFAGADRAPRWDP